MTFLQTLIDVISGQKKINDLLSVFKDKSLSKKIGMTILFIIMSLFFFYMRPSDKPQPTTNIYDNRISGQNVITSVVNNYGVDNKDKFYKQVDPITDYEINPIDESNTNKTIHSKLNGFTIFSMINGANSNSLSEKLISILQPKLNNEKFIYSSLVNEDCFQKALGGDMSCLLPSLNKSAIRYVVLVQGVEEEHSIQSYAGSVLLTVKYSGSILDNRSQQVIKRFEYSGRASNINSRLAKEEVEPKFLDSLKKIYIEL